MSFLNADTGLYIPEYRDIEPRYVDLSDLDTTSIKLRCHLEGDTTNTPSLDSWKITWKKKVPKPEYLGGIPSTISVMEDTPENTILDLSEYFGETRSDSLTYAIESISNDNNIHVEVNGSKLDVTYLEENWTGRINLIVNCSNTNGESASSDRFYIAVEEVDDPPAWTAASPSITIEEDEVYTTDYSYLDFLTDVENDLLDISASCSVNNVTLYVSGDGYLTVNPDKDYFGTSTVTVTAKEKYNPTLKTTATIPLTIEAVNDDPSVTLSSPGNGASLNDINVTLSWSGTDIDTHVEDLTYDIHFGTNSNPSVLYSDIEETTYDLMELDDKTTYYWYVKARDGDGGVAGSPTWSFHIDTEGEVIPGDTTGDMGDLNLTIVVDIEKVIVEQGKETSFDMEIKNEGEVTINLAVVTSGDAAPCLSLNNILTILPGETKTETVIVTRTSLLEPGNYTISLVFISPGGMKYLKIPLWIQEGEGSTDEPGKNGNGDGITPTTETKSSDTSWFYVIITILFLFIIFLAVVGFLVNSKLKSRIEDFEKGREEVLEPDSAYMAGRAPFQPQVEDRTYIPASPGPYQPPDYSGHSYEPRVSIFEPTHAEAPQQSAGIIPPTREPSVPAQQVQPPETAIPIEGGATVPVADGPNAPAVHESLLNPIEPLVQLPRTTGPKQEEQKFLPKLTATTPPPPT